MTGRNRRRPRPVQASLSADEQTEQASRLLINPEPGWVLNYGAMAVFAALIAGLGMRLDSAAIVIGAMLVAPVMRPVLGLGFACLTAVPARNVKRLLVVLAVTSIGLVGIGWLLSIIIPSTEVGLSGEVLSRTAPDVRDLVVALAAGAVGAFAILRPKVAETISGVAIAVALVPPPVAAGIAFGESFKTQAIGALLLYVTNLAAIVVGTVVTVLALRLVDERPFAIDTKRVLTAGLTAVTITIGIGALLYDDFTDATRDAQADRDAAAQAATDTRQQNLARDQLESWIGSSDQPNLGVVSIALSPSDSNDSMLVSVVLLGDADAYIPSLADTEAKISDALDRDVLLKLRLVGVSDQVSSEFEIEPNAASNADALLRTAMENALREWTQPLTAAQIVSITTPEPGSLLARVAVPADPPPLDELNRLLSEQLDVVPPYQLIIDELVLAPTRVRAQSPGARLTVRVMLDHRSIPDLEICSTDGTADSINLSSDQLDIEVRPTIITISSGDRTLSTNDVITKELDDTTTIIAVFDETGSTIDTLTVDVSATGPIPGC